MPSNPDAAADAPSPPPERTLVGDTSNAVGFLDAPGLGPDALTTAIHDAADVLAAGSILTVYNDHPTGHLTVDELCDHGELTLVATISHPTGGTTFTLRTPS